MKETFDDFDGRLVWDKYSGSARTKLVGLCHVSNVLGCVNPIERVAKKCQSVDAKLLVDACQSVPWTIIWPHESCKLDLGSQITRHFQSFYIYICFYFEETVNLTLCSAMHSSGHTATRTVQVVGRALRISFPVLNTCTGTSHHETHIFNH